MKKLLMGLLFSLITVVGFSNNGNYFHSITPICYYNNLYTLRGNDLPIGGTMNVTVLGTTYDSTIAIVASTQTFTVPQENRLVPVTVIVTFSDGTSIEIETGTNSCAPLGDANVTVKQQILSNGNIGILVEMPDEVSISQILIRHKITKKIYAIILPKGAKSYYVIIKQ